MNIANVAYFYDFALLLLFAFTAVRAWQAGFLASLADLAGKVLGIVGGAWGSRVVAPYIYAQYVGNAVSARVESALAQSGGDLAAALAQLTFLPESVRQALASAVADGADALPRQVVDALEPVILPLLQLVLALVLCVAIAWLFKLVVGLLRHVNGIPLVGGVNRFFGLLMGLLGGFVNCWLAVMVLWFLVVITAGKVDFLAGGVVGRSIGYSFLSAFNPFLTHY